MTTLEPRTPTRPERMSTRLEGGIIHHLRAGGVSLVVDARGPRLPRLVHWGADLGDMPDALLSNLAAADVQGVVSNVPDEPVIPGIVTEHATVVIGARGLAKVVAMITNRCVLRARDTQVSHHRGRRRTDLNS